jgi:hypothetical protein
MCEAMGLTSIRATVVDHIKPHHNTDIALFWDETNWQGLCEHHHNSTKQAIEKGRSVTLSMTYVTGSDGKYQGALGYDAGVKAGRLYLATVQAISAAGLRATWSETVIALDRAD